MSARCAARRLATLGLIATLASACSRVRTFGESQRSAPSAEASRPAAPALVPTGAASVPSFPGAEGFGARARGGRGGAVCHVTTLVHAGPGSLQSCFDASGPRTVVFDVSGVVEGPLEIKHGRLTVAGQTAVNGIVVKGGVVCDNVYDPNDCNDVIVRHVRFRGGAPDSLRIGGAHDIVFDHCSFASAEDENVELTRSRNITIQHSVIAEPRGEHYRWGGVLINYSKDVMPLDAITIHHSVWNGVAGRLPEIACEDNDDGPGKSACKGHVASIEISNNVLWDASDPIWFNRCTGTNEGNDCPATSRSTFSVRMNLVGNVLVRRTSADADAPLAEPSLFAERNAVYASDNVLFRGSERLPAGGRSAPARQPLPPVTYTPSGDLVAMLAREAGAFPRDRMDERLASYLSRPVDARPAAWRSERGVDVGDSFAGRLGAERPPLDSDRDGIADAWEKAHGLDPSSAVDGASFGKASGCAVGYSALECYVNELADARTPR